MADTGSSAGLRSQLTFPMISIAIPTFIHFIIVCLVLIDNRWLPPVYEFSHLCCFGVALWTIHTNEQVRSLLMLLAVVIFTIVTDIAVLGLYFPGEQAAKGNGENIAARTWQFSAAMCIINLLLKPISIVLIVYSVFTQDSFEFTRPKDLCSTRSNPQWNIQSGRPNLEEEGSVSGPQPFPLLYQSDEYHRP